MMTSNKVFLKKNKTPIFFQMLPNPKRKELRILIERHGGKLVSFPNQNSIKIRFPENVNTDSPDYLFSTAFIEDSIRKNSVQDINLYKLSKGPENHHSGIDINKVMLGEITWNELNSSINNVAEKSVRVTTYFTYNEKCLILKYILNNNLCSKTSGTEIWKEMEEKQICHYRSWNSMRSCFLKTIVNELHIYELSLLDRKKLSKQDSEQECSSPSNHNHQASPENETEHSDGENLEKSDKSVDKLFDAAAVRAASHFQGDRFGLKLCEGYVIKKSQRLHVNGGLGFRKNRDYYKLKDDLRIINHIYREGLEKKVKGRLIWVNMEGKYGRSWQSLRNRYLRYILPVIEAYGISSKICECLKTGCSGSDIRKRGISVSLNSTIDDIKTNDDNRTTSDLVSEKSYVIDDVHSPREVVKDSEELASGMNGCVTPCRKRHSTTKKKPAIEPLAIETDERMKLRRRLRSSPRSNTKTSPETKTPDRQKTKSSKYFPVEHSPEVLPPVKSNISAPSLEKSEPFLSATSKSFENSALNMPSTSVDHTASSEASSATEKLSSTRTSQRKKSSLTSPPKKTASFSKSRASVSTLPENNAVTRSAGHKTRKNNVVCPKTSKNSLNLEHSTKKNRGKQCSNLQDNSTECTMTKKSKLANTSVVSQSKSRKASNINSISYKSSISNSFSKSDSDHSGISSISWEVDFSGNETSDTDIID